MLSSSVTKARPIPIKTSFSSLPPSSHKQGTNSYQQPQQDPYPSPVSPTTLTFSPAQFLQTYQLPRTFTARYALSEELGFGGFGFVYAITRLDDSARFACKFIFKSKVARSSWTRDLEIGTCPMEVAVLKNVKHDNIIEFVDYFEDSVFCFCITKIHGAQWIDDSDSRPGSRRSMDLFECIEKYESFAEPLARHIFIQIVCAVSHLNDIGLVHRDIKDENILIDDNFHVKLIDFGSAAFFDPTGVKLFDMFLGTKQYASPEILQQKQYRGPEAEIWALGCCLYIILTGLVPFGSAQQALKGMYSKPQRPLTKECVHLLDRMFECDPTQRITIREIKSHPWVTGKYH